jgi:hypothetical protein
MSFSLRSAKTPHQNSAVRGSATGMESYCRTLSRRSIGDLPTRSVRTKNTTSRCCELKMLEKLTPKRFMRNAALLEILSFHTKVPMT